MPERNPYRVSAVALDGTNNVTLVSAPPVGVTYWIRGVSGFNSSGAARTIFLWHDRNGTNDPVWQSNNAASLAVWQPANGGPTVKDANIVLVDTTQTLLASTTAACTDRLICFYQEMEAPIE